jgi:uncharacterized protein (TIGR03435 family)
MGVKMNIESSAAAGDKAHLLYAWVPASRARLVIGVLAALLVSQTCSYLYPALAQSSAGGSVAFDVVSVKPNGSAHTVLTPGVMGRNPTYAHNSPGRLSWNQSLSYFLRQAYRVEDWQIKGPAWLEEDAFQLDAAMPANTPKETVQLMLRRMLAERFQLTLHTDEKEIPVYYLVVAPGGARIRDAKDSDARIKREESGHTSWASVSTTELAMHLTWAAKRSVIDTTGLKGRYQVDLRWTRDPEATTDTDRGILEAIEQIGLKLEAGKKSYPFLIIDHANRIPTPN